MVTQLPLVLALLAPAARTEPAEPAAPTPGEPAEAQSPTVLRLAIEDAGTGSMPSYGGPCFGRKGSKSSPTDCLRCLPPFASEQGRRHLVGRAAGGNLPPAGAPVHGLDPAGVRGWLVP